MYCTNVIVQNDIGKQIEEMSGSLHVKRFFVVLPPEQTCCPCITKQMIFPEIYRTSFFQKNIIPPTPPPPPPTHVSSGPPQM